MTICYHKHDTNKYTKIRKVVQKSHLKKKKKNLGIDCHHIYNYLIIY